MAAKSDVSLGYIIEAELSAEQLQRFFHSMGWSTPELVEENKKREYSQLDHLALQIFLRLLKYLSQDICFMYLTQLRISGGLWVVHEEIRKSEKCELRLSSRRYITTTDGNWDIWRFRNVSADELKEVVETITLDLKLLVRQKCK